MTTVTVIEEVISLTQEIIETIVVTVAEHGGATDHGALTGLADDDHAQYHNDARGDARYALIAQGVTNGDSHDHSGGDGAQIAYSGLSGLPTLGSAAATDSTAYATAAQGSTADTALQPGDDAADLGSGAATDGYVLTADGAGGAAWEAAIGGDAATAIHAATEKTTPVDADEIGLVDSAASWVLKKLRWANLKTTLSSVFAVLAGKSGGQTLIGGTGITDKLVLQGTSGNGTSTETAVEVKVGNNGATSALSVLNDGRSKISEIYLSNNEINTYTFSIPVYINRRRELDGASGSTYVGNTFINYDSGSCIIGSRNYGAKFNIGVVGSAGISDCAAWGSIGNAGEGRGTGFTFYTPNAGDSRKAGIIAFAQASTGSAFVVQTTNNFSTYNEVLRVNNSGNFAVGNISPSARIHATSTTEQLRLGYDATYYVSFTVNSSGALTQTAVGGQTLIGGTGVTNKIVLQGTSANGTSTAAALEMKVGNNGATTAMTLKNDGNIYVPGIIENTTSGEGIILKSPDGTRYKITVANGGTLSVSAA